MQIFIQNGSERLCFRNPDEILTARTGEEVERCLDRIADDDRWAAGFVCYEAAGAFDAALKTKEPGPLPLLCFGLFQNTEPVEDLAALRPMEGGYELGRWTPSVERAEYARVIDSVKERIAAGETYQVNYTFFLEADFRGDPLSFFRDLAAAQQSKHSAYIETGEFAICSASPELFFSCENGVITSKPMKGTLPRGRTAAEDRAAAEALRSSEKNRAENIMITDMIRNDIGRAARFGSVKTVRRFDVEKYPTVWQMTSTVQGTTAGRGDPAARRRELKTLFKALFPCASVTGAPKARTMEIIQALEKKPRGIYTGAIGMVRPDGGAVFSVAIRTALIDRAAGRAEYGTGGGIVWDSLAGPEYDEALLKTQILTRRDPPFQLLETMLYEPENGIFLLARHLKRLKDSAEFFDFQIDAEKICAQLQALRFKTTMRLRLLLDKTGTVEIQTFEINPQESPQILVPAAEPVNAADPFLYHKTTHRAVYDRAQSGCKESEEALLFNERGEVTESGTANIVIERNGKRITPPVSCGLLPGTFRDELLESGQIEEKPFTLEEVKQAEAVWLINSVRKWRRAVLKPDSEAVR